MSAEIKGMQRKSFIDIAKGIGILLVVLGHLDVDGQVSREIIYSFHMPLFFILSGAVSSKRALPFKEYFIKALKTTYLPYAVFLVIDIVCAAFTNDFLTYLKADLLALTGFGFKAINRPIWFLFALFVIKIIFWFIQKSKIAVSVSALIGILYVFFADKIGISYKCLYPAAMVGLVFYIIGSLLSKYIMNIDTAFENTLKRNHSVLTYITAIVTTVGLLTLLVFTAHSNSSISMFNHKFNNPFLYFANAALGSLVTLFISVLLAKINIISKLLCFYGENSIIIMTLHYPVCRRLLPIIVNKLGYEDYLYHPVLQLAVLAGFMIVIPFVIKFINKYLYFLFGKKKQPSKNN